MEPSSPVEPGHLTSQDVAHWLGGACQEPELLTMQAHCLECADCREQVALVAQAMAGEAEMDGDPSLGFLLQIGEAAARRVRSRIHSRDAISKTDHQERRLKQTGAFNIWRRNHIWAWGLAAAGLVITVGVSTWYFLFRQPRPDQGLAALHQAYRKQRPLEARITGFGYAPFTKERGDSQGEKVDEKLDYIALERAKILLFGSSDKNADPAMAHAIGQYYLAQKEFNRASDQLKLALDQSPNDARIHSDLGVALLGKAGLETSDEQVKERARDIDQALRHFNSAIELNPSSLDTLYNRALLYQKSGMNRQAREQWEEYLRKDPSSLWAAEARRNLQEVNERLKKVSQQREQLYQTFLAAYQAGDVDRAFEVFSLSYSYNGNYIIEKLIDGLLEARLNQLKKEDANIIHILSHLGRIVQERSGDRWVLDLARYYQQASLAQVRLAQQGRKLMVEAYHCYQQSRNDQAVEKYEEARQSFNQADDGIEALFAEAWIGQCHHQRSDIKKNLQVFSNLVPVLVEKQYRWMQANALCGLANAHDSSGWFSQAIDDSLQAGKIAADLKDQAGIMRSSYQLAGFYYSLGKHEENLRISGRGLIFANQIAAEIRYAISFYNLFGWSLSALGFHDAALAFQQEVVRMAEESKSPRLNAYAHIYLGVIYTGAKRYQEAIESTQLGIRLGQELGSDETGQDFIHTGLLQLGHVYRAAGRFTEALAAFEQVIKFFQRSGKQAYFYGASKGRLLTLIEQEKDAEARREIENVIALYEKYRQSIQEVSNRNSFFDQEQSIYDVAINFVYSRLKNPQMAFDYSELSRARSLLDISAREWEIIAGPEAPDLRSGGVSQPESLSEVQQQLPYHVQIIEYTALKDRLLIWVISKSDVKTYSVEISLADLTERVNQYLDLIGHVPDPDSSGWQARANDLYDVLIRPVEAALGRQKLLCLIPDKVLNRLPFEALISRSSNQFLIEQYPLIYASSASMFLRATGKARQKDGIRNEQLLAVGDPRFDRKIFKTLADLPSAAEEAIKVAAFYNSRSVLVGTQAKKSAVLNDIKMADIVHLAMHYVPDKTYPMMSKLPLAVEVGDKGQDSVLQVHELYQLQSLRARLIVLSACQTRAEEIMGGEGAIGISRLFEAAGVPLVVSTLWPVDSGATCNLMIKFHRERTQVRRSTVEALQAAQIEAIHASGIYRHPYYWAAFIVVGGYSEY